MKPIVFSETNEDVTRNLLKLHSFARGDDRQRNFHFDRVYNAEHQVHYKSAEGSLFAPVKWCGARDNSITDYPERKRKVSGAYQAALRRIGYRPVCLGDPGYDKVYEEFLDYCRGFGFKNSSAGVPHSASRPRQFWSTGFDGPTIQTFPDELDIEETIVEGASITRTVNAFERSAKARIACIAHYGWKCQACGIDFEAIYGDRGKEFIHVHHVVPLAEIGAAYTVDPIKDLRPVCPNCHAMIHRFKPALGVEELAVQLRKKHG